MTHYQKIATIIFRVIGVTVLIITLLLMILSFLISLPSMNSVMVFITFSPHLIVAIVSFALSRFLAKLVCFDFDKSDEQK